MSTFKTVNQKPASALWFTHANTYSIHGDHCPLPVFILQRLGIQLKEINSFFWSIQIDICIHDYFPNWKKRLPYCLI